MPSDGLPDFDGYSKFILLSHTQLVGLSTPGELAIIPPYEDKPFGFEYWSGDLVPPDDGERGHTQMLPSAITMQIDGHRHVLDIYARFSTFNADGNVTSLEHFEVFRSLLMRPEYSNYHPFALMLLEQAEAALRSPIEDLED